MYLRISITVFEIPLPRKQMNTADVKSELGQEQALRDSMVVK